MAFIDILSEKAPDDGLAAPMVGRSSSVQIQYRQTYLGVIISGDLGNEDLGDARDRLSTE